MSSACGEGYIQSSFSVQPQWTAQLNQWGHTQQMANRVYLEGNITRDTTVVPTQGMPMAFLHLAADREYEGRDGTPRRTTLFSSVVCFGELAEYATHATKGRRVIIEGALRTRERDNGDGAKRQELEVVADTLRVMESREHAVAERDAATQAVASGEHAL